MAHTHAAGSEMRLTFMLKIFICCLANIKNLNAIKNAKYLHQPELIVEKKLLVVKCLIGVA